MDAVGGELNAFTAHEYTCYYAHGPRRRPAAGDRRRLRPGDLGSGRAGGRRERARGHPRGDLDARRRPRRRRPRRLRRGALRDHPLGRPVIGSVAGIQSLSAPAIADYYRSRYRARQPGRQRRRQHRPRRPWYARVGEAFGDLARCRAGRAAPRRSRRRSSVARSSRTGRPSRPTWCSACPGSRGRTTAGTPWPSSTTRSAAACPRGCSRRCASAADWPTASTATASQHHDTGMFGVYAGCAPEQGRRGAGRSAASCSTRSPTKGVTDDEIDRAKGQLRGSTVLGLEDTGSQMSRIGKAELVHGDVLGVEDVLARFEAVTADDVRAVAETVLRQQLSLGIIGPFPDRDFAEVALYEGRCARCQGPDGLGGGARRRGVRATCRSAAPTTSATPST